MPHMPIPWAATRGRRFAVRPHGGGLKHGKGNHPGVRRLPELFVIMQHKSSLHSPNDRFEIALHSPAGNLQTGLPVGPLEKRAAKLAF